MDKRPTRRVRALVYLALGVVFVAATGPYFGYWRAVIGFAIAAAILGVGLGYFRSVGSSAPDPLPQEPETELHYVCSVCGLDVVVVIAGSDRPPTHCREKMDLVGRALRPLD